MEIIKDILTKSKTEKSIIEIRTYEDPDQFWCGYVENFTDELVFFRHFTKYGKPDGVLLLQRHDIESIDFDDDYSKVMRYLVDHNTELDQDIEVSVSIGNFDRWQYDLLDQQVGNEKSMVSLQINNDNVYTGFVKWIDEESLILNLIGKNGEDEGKSVYKLEDITHVQINDLDNRCRMLLHHWRKERK